MTEGVSCPPSPSGPTPAGWAYAVTAKRDARAAGTSDAKLWDSNLMTGTGADSRFHTCAHSSRKRGPAPRTWYRGKIGDGATVTRAAEKCLSCCGPTVMLRRA